VGMKGSRVQAIIRELRGERIDIIEWSEDPAVFAANALSPAKVSKVEINSFEEKKLTVTVPEDQLSLAIGKKGQNVRLAAKLLGWHIDIRSAEEAARAAAAQLEAVMAGGEATLTDIRDSLALDQITAERLKDRGIENIDQLALISVDELVDAIDVSFDQANEILERAHRLLAQKHARETREAREADEAAARAAETIESAPGLAEGLLETINEGTAIEEQPAEEATTSEGQVTPGSLEEPSFPESFEAKGIGAEEIVQQPLFEETAEEATVAEEGDITHEASSVAAESTEPEAKQPEESAAELSEEASSETSASKTAADETSVNEHRSEEDGKQKSE